MNKNVQNHVDPLIFSANDRIRLYTECNKYKSKLNETELALYYEKKWNRVLTALLIVIITILIGAFLYVFYG